MSQALPITLYDVRLSLLDLVEQLGPGVYRVSAPGYLPYAMLHVRARDVLVAVYRRGARRDALIDHGKAQDLKQGIRLARAMVRAACIGEVAPS